MISGNSHRWKAVPTYYIRTILEPYYLSSGAEEWHWDMKTPSQRLIRVCMGAEWNAKRMWIPLPVEAQAWLKIARGHRCYIISPNYHRFQLVIHLSLRTPWAWPDITFNLIKEWEHVKDIRKWDGSINIAMIMITFICLFSVFIMEHRNGNECAMTCPHIQFQQDTSVKSFA